MARDGHNQYKDQTGQDSKAHTPRHCHGLHNVKSNPTRGTQKHEVVEWDLARPRPHSSRQGDSMDGARRSLTLSNPH